DGLAVLHRHPRAEYLIVEGRRALNSVCCRSCHIAHLLGDVEGDEAPRVDPRRYLHDDARRVIVDAVDNRRIGRKRARRGPGQNRHLLAYLQPCRLVVENHDLWRRQYFDLGYIGKRGEREVWRLGEDEVGESRRKWDMV